MTIRVQFVGSNPRTGTTLLAELMAADFFLIGIMSSCHHGAMRLRFLRRWLRRGLRFRP